MRFYGTATYRTRTSLFRNLAVHRGEQLVRVLVHHNEIVVAISKVLSIIVVCNYVDKLASNTGPIGSTPANVFDRKEAASLSYFEVHML